MTYRNFIVYQNKNLGDLLLTTPLLSALLEPGSDKVSGGAIHVICKRAGHPIINTMSDRLHLHSKPSSLVDWLRLIRLLPNGSRTLMLLPHTSRVALVLAKLLKVKSVASEQLSVLGFKPDFVTPARYTPWRHISEQHLDLWRRVGGVVCDRHRSLYRPKIAKVCVDPRLLNSPYIVVHPGSRWLFKTPQKKFWEILASGITALGFQVVLTGSDDVLEKKICDSISSAIDCVSFAGKTSIHELGYLISNSAAYVGVDSFSSHLAASLGGPGMVIFGPTSEEIWGPYGKQNNLRVFTSHNFGCRPCHVDGCGGSKQSDCLDNLNPNDALMFLRSCLGSESSPWL